MTYTKLNTKLVEEFGNLERICNQIYDSKHGVTNYIEEMIQVKSNAIRKVSNWEYYIYGLKQVRHKRNKLSHGEASFNSQLASKEEIDFIIFFRNKIMNQTDPMSLYYKASRSHSKNRSQYSNQQKSYNYSMPRRSSKILGGCASVLLLLSILIASIVWIYFGL